MPACWLTDAIKGHRRNNNKKDLSAKKNARFTHTIAHFTSLPFHHLVIEEAADIGGSDGLAIVLGEAEESEDVVDAPDLHPVQPRGSVLASPEHERLPLLLPLVRLLLALDGRPVGQLLIEPLLVPYARPAGRRRTANIFANAVPDMVGGGGSCARDLGNRRIKHGGLGLLRLELIRCVHKVKVMPNIQTYKKERR